MMRARGYFRSGNIKKYDCEAIELPYDVSFNLTYLILQKKVALFTLTSLSEYSLFDACLDATKCRRLEKSDQ